MIRPFAAFLLSVALMFGQASSLERARDLYLKAVDGDRDSSRESEKIFEELVKQRPGDALPLAYLGSVRVLESGRTMAVWKRGKLAKEGLDALDKAVASSPDRAEVRFLRAVSTYHLPGYFKREQQCAEDFALLVPQVEKAVASGEMERRFAAAAHYYYGLLLDKRGDRASARREWGQAARIAPETRVASDAARRLKGS